MKPFTENVIKIIKQIPEGKVMTYGQIAKTAGSPRGARQVVRILHSMSRKYDLPWHRVINVKGEIAIKDEEGAWNQKMMLEDEGIEVSETGKLNLEKYRFHLDLNLDEEL
ncbi:DNA methyltransferase [Virgibacillus profundi]|uniref:DNA methyltransferase n=1 Tax=Virgibacillus profundi TaxID=2024555 RepID=A0A2A2IKD9_9BACI|nr:MGMT family protein [Virgibacillus profundi]PAV31630.1 DNA methyltransferase [Virgibacillus profundi]PXY55816.1 DNA methyltransferase [Virgibacillus profundi]